LSGGEARKAAGLRPGGVSVVITNMAVMRMDAESGEMVLDRFYPGITPDAILDKMQFPVDISRAQEAVPPTAEELKTLREECDPQRLIL
jgi:glutaconate CoA-transferase subunit B